MSGIVAERAGSDRGLARETGARRLVADIELFGQVVAQAPLRRYQSRVARAALESIAGRRGLTITVLMPRQAGKNELSAQLEAFLLTRHQRVGGSLGK